jgi:riboflavin kinase / FMN adenylyltransferase
MAAMRLVTTPGSKGSRPAPAIAVVGEFDGLHLGHQALLAAANDVARRADRLVVAVVLDRADGSPALTTLARRCELLLQAGAHVAVVAGPEGNESDRDDLSAVARSLRDELGSELAFVACPPEPSAPLRWPALRPALGRAGIEVIELPRERDGQGRVVTTTLIAEELRSGRLDLVNAALGRPHRVSGVVEIGDQRGRTLGFPTANIPLDHTQVWPALGVYAARVQAGREHHLAAVNIGVRPTIYGPDGAPLLEAHLLDFDGDLYGKVLAIDLVERLRPERRFTGLEELAAQLQSDVALARLVLTERP